MNELFLGFLLKHCLNFLDSNISGFNYKPLIFNNQSHQKIFLLFILSCVYEALKSTVEVKVCFVEWLVAVSASLVFTSIIGYV